MAEDSEVRDLMCFISKVAQKGVVMEVGEERRSVKTPVFHSLSLLKPHYLQDPRIGE